jgi:hypothetical protein
LRLKVANYHQYESLHKEKRDLQEEILPTLQYHEDLARAAATSQSLRNSKRLLKTQDEALSGRRQHLAQQAHEVSDAKQAEAALEAEESALREKLQQINAKLKPQESLLEQKSRLQKLAAEADADVANVADDLEKKKPNSRARKRNATRSASASPARWIPSPRCKVNLHCPTRKTCATCAAP